MCLYLFGVFAAIVSSCAAESTSASLPTVKIASARSVQLITPEFAVLEVGQDIDVACNAPDGYDGIIQWYNELGDLLVKGQGSIVFSFTNVSMADSEKINIDFLCQVGDGDFNKSAPHFQLRLFLVEYSVTTELPIGGKITVACDPGKRYDEPVAQPQQFVWTKNGRPTGDAPSKKIEVDLVVPELYGNFNVRELTAEDSGCYVCSVWETIVLYDTISDDKRRVSSSCFTSAPEASGTDVQTVFSGTTLTLQCDYYGFPMPSVKWYKKDYELQAKAQWTEINDAFIAQDARMKFTSNEKDLSQNYANGWISIDNVTAADEGLYVCEASNKFGKGLSTTQVRVAQTEACASIPVPFGDKIDLPVITNEPESTGLMSANNYVLALIGTDVVLACSVPSKPDEMIQWYDHTGKLYSNGVGNAVLELSDIQHENDLMVYYCQSGDGPLDTVNKKTTSIKTNAVEYLAPTKALPTAPFTIKCDAGGLDQTLPDYAADWTGDFASRYYIFTLQGVDVLNARSKGQILHRADGPEKYGDLQASSCENLPRPPTPDRAGCYACTTWKSKEDYDVDSANRRVMSGQCYTSAPLVKASTGSVVKISGDSALLECIPYGYPQPTVSWYKLDSPDSPIDDWQAVGWLNDLANSRINVAPNGMYTNASLILNDLRKDDSGWYLCEAVNSFGSSSAMIQVRVGAKSCTGDTPFGDQLLSFLDQYNTCSQN